MTGDVLLGSFAVGVRGGYLSVRCGIRGDAARVSIFALRVGNECNVMYNGVQWYDIYSSFLGAWILLVYEFL